MKIEVTHPDTGEKVVLDMPNLSADQIREMASEFSSDKQLESKLDNLPLSAEGKAFLAKFMKFTLKAGGTAIKLGKKLVEIAIFVATKLKHLTFWTVLGAIVAFMVTMIPLIGPLLGSFLSPIMMLGGIAKGFYEQVKSSDPSIVEIIENSTTSFRPLNGEFA